MAPFTCPKSMEYGPCGGVTLDGACEVAPDPCPFVDVPVVRWSGTAGAPARTTLTEATPTEATPTEATPTEATPTEATPTEATPAAAVLRAALARGGVVVADLPARALDVASLRACAAALAGRVDAVLAGDSGQARVQFPPSYRALLLQQEGLPVWSGFNNRDRNRVALEGELAALAHVGVAGVHCVTGDHTLTGDRPDARPVFDLDSTRTAALARAAGHLVSVGESPSTPPVERRPERLLEKQRAGAEVCFVNHTGGADAVGRFIGRARDVGVDLAFVACVPVVVDRESAGLLRTFTTLVLPEGYLDGILAARDPFEAGVRAAVDLARQFAALDGVAGVNLSGGAGEGRERWFAEALARIADEVRAAG